MGVMARHSHEGQYFPWTSRLSFDAGHLVVQAAFAGHPSYDAHCGARLRFIHPLDGSVSDWVVVRLGTVRLPSGDHAARGDRHDSMGVLKDHFGVASATEVGHAKQGEGSIQRAIDANYYVAGPRSPLWQAENGRLAAGAAQDTGACANHGGPTAAEQAAIGSGLGVSSPGPKPSVGKRVGRTAR